MNLIIGLAGNNQGWETILQQEGVIWEVIDQTTLPAICADLVCLIAPDNIDLPADLLLDYISNGGTIIFEAGKYAEVFRKKQKLVKAKALFPDEDSLFADLEVVDIYGKITKVKDIAGESLDKELGIFHGRIGQGRFFLIPFQLEGLYSDPRSRRKRFPASRKELPSEIVSTVSRGKFRRMVLKILQEIHRQKDLPFLQKWYLNSSHESSFSFRVDTDYCTAGEAEDLVQVCNDHQISATWFIDTKNEGMITSTYTPMQDQEIAFHCDRHRVFKDIERNRHYLEKGLKKLAERDLAINGYAAPFGEWNEALGTVLDEKEFAYSSEFSLNYDDLPFYPYSQANRFKTLQIPVHPISLGRLRRSHFTPLEMIRYYQELIDLKITLQEPVLLYHHPAHKYLEVIAATFEYVRSKNLPVMNFEQWSVWWKYRDLIDLKAKLVNNKIKLSTGGEVDLHLKISYRNSYCITPFQTELDLQKLDWQEEPHPRSRNVNKTIRKWHWRDLLYNFESFRGKRKK